jgi:hypothetical protein
VAKTLQQLITDLRILVGEPDKDNSRWQDETHGKYYINEGRKQFSKQSKCLIGEFRRITSIGVTAIGANEEARYTLDPQLFEIISVKWNGLPLDACDITWENKTGRDFDTSDNTSGRNGIPFAFRKIGNSLDLYFFPNEEKVLSIIGYIMTIDLSLLTDIDEELTDDQDSAAVKYAAYKALEDDGRDGSSYYNDFITLVSQYNRIANPITSVGVKQTQISEY